MSFNLENKPALFIPRTTQHFNSCRQLRDRAQTIEKSICIWMIFACSQFIDNCCCFYFLHFTSHIEKMITNYENRTILSIALNIYRNRTTLVALWKKTIRARSIFLSVVLRTSDLSNVYRETRARVNHNNSACVHQVGSPVSQYHLRIGRSAAGLSEYPTNSHTNTHPHKETTIK